MRPLPCEPQERHESQPAVTRVPMPPEAEMAALAGTAGGFCPTLRPGPPGASCPGLDLRVRSRPLAAARLAVWLSLTCRDRGL